MEKMKNKISKHTEKIIIPKYDVEKQLEFFSDICNDIEFDAKVLITLIFADWILNIQTQCKHVGIYQAMKDFLLDSEKTFNALKKLKDEVEAKNEKIVE